jgi:hypothetical protein
MVGSTIVVHGNYIHRIPQHSLYICDNIQLSNVVEASPNPSSPVNKQHTLNTVGADTKLDQRAWCTLCIQTSSIRATSVSKAQ